MFKEFRKEIQWGGRPLTLESGKIARQADGAVLVTYGETKVLCTVVYEKAPKPGLDFFPLSVHYQEKTFAAGKIPGGFFKREGRPAEKEVLSSRLIDRPIRPLFAKGYRNETQIICTVLSHDLENDPDIVAMIGSSAALTLSGVPFLGPIGGCRVGHIAGEYVLNPQLDELPNSALDLVVAGTREGVLMVESEAKELSEEVMLGAVMFGHRAIQQVIDAIVELAEACAREPIELPAPPAGLADLSERLRASGEGDLRTAYGESGKAMRREKVAALKLQLSDALSADESLDAEVVFDGFEDAFKDLEKDVVRKSILTDKRRIDGRGPADIRPIAVEVGLLPRAHGSALFTRGETQALVVTTLGTERDAQVIDALEGEYRDDFLLHYNFPPYCVGETGRMGATKRREIGHGRLAKRAIAAVLPTKGSFPYTLRIVSEITESNGSSSMATVCGGSLALMDAGVPVTEAVAGIAMGLITDGSRFAVLSDILGDEDHLGDMDFKVAGTATGVTALQMDIKVMGITAQIMQAALEQAREGRVHILGEMAKALAAPREQMSDYAPRILTMRIHPDKIRDVIGKGGVTIRGITEQTGTTIDIDDDGTVRIASVDRSAGEQARAMIERITSDIEVGMVYEGRVARLMDFGAFVTILPGRDGLLHISQISEERVERVSDKLAEGDVVRVKVLEVDKQGRIRLSMKALAEGE